MTHAGLIFMLLGQLVTDKYQVESNLRLEEGQTKGYSISGNECELLIIDKSQPNTDTVAAIPAEVLDKNKTYRTGSLPFEVTVLDYFTTSDLVQLGQGQPNKATRGKGLELATIDKESVTSLEEVNFPGAYIKLQSTEAPSLAPGWSLRYSAHSANRSPSRPSSTAARSTSWPCASSATTRRMTSS